jgi:hypothetical protein
LKISKYKQPSFATLLLRALLYRISRHVSANSKPSSGVVAYRILQVSNHIKKNVFIVEYDLNTGTFEGQKRADVEKCPNMKVLATFI